MSRLAELEEQLRDIEIRWTTARDQGDAQTQFVSLVPAVPSSLDVAVAGRSTFGGPCTESAVPDELQRIHDSAKAKAMLAFKSELLPATSNNPQDHPDEYQPAAPQHHSTLHLPPYSKTSLSNQWGSMLNQPATHQQQPASADSKMPSDQSHIGATPACAMEAFSSMAAAAPASGAYHHQHGPVNLQPQHGMHTSLPPAANFTAASTWEGKKSAALLAMESDKRQLQEAVEKLNERQRQAQQQQQQLASQHQLQLQQLATAHELQLQQLAVEHQQQLQAQGQQLQQQGKQHRQQLLELNLQHQEDQKHAAGAAGEKLSTMLHTAWQLFARQRYRKLLVIIFSAWRRAAVQSHRLVWAELVWNRRVLEAYFTEWNAAAAAISHHRQLAAQSLEKQARRLQTLERRCTALHMRRLLAAWQQRTSELACKHALQARATRHWLAVLGHAVLSTLAREAFHAPWQQELVSSRMHKLRLKQCFKAWAQLHRLWHLYHRNLLLQLVRTWAGYTRFALAVRHKVAAFQMRCQHSQLGSVLSKWRKEAEYRRRLREGEQQMSSRLRSRMLQMCLHQLRLAARQASALQTILLKRKQGMLHAWLSTSRGQARSRRVLEAYLGTQLGQLLRAVFQQWQLLCSASARERQARDVQALQSYIGELQHEVKGAGLQQLAAVEASSAMQQENRELRLEARRQLVVLAPEGFMSRQLSWRALPADPGGASEPAPRCRHLALLLPGIQGVQQQVPGAGGGRREVPALSSTVVLFGGVGGDSWYNDANVLVVNQSVDGTTSSSWHSPVMAHSTSLDTATAAPLPRPRDFAGCACGPNQFLLHGGFDGSTELSSMHVFTIHRLDGSSSAATAAAASSFSAASSPEPAFSLSWRTVEPRNSAPPPRSHHTATYAEHCRTVVLFGGYSSNRGLLSELWAFSLDHMEWWQPEITGDHPSPRRGHAAVMVGEKLLVHGGFNGSHQLGDLWELDLTVWHWQRLECKGTAPSARRGHAADSVAGRFLVVHGGYDGSRLLGDAYCLDTRTATWSTLEVSAGPEDMPAPRSLHTLTSVGHACVLLGGSGALGPLSGVHLLESPAVSGGLMQQHRLLEVRRELTEAQQEAVQLQAQLRQAVLDRDHHLQQKQAVEIRTADLTSRYNTAVRTVSELKDALAAADAALASSQAHQRDLQLEVATLKRRVDRARQGGREVAGGVEALHMELHIASTRLTELEASLDQALAAAHDAQAAALQLSGERQALQMQLAAAANETAVLRQVAAAVEQQHQAAAARAQARAEEEVRALRGRMEEKASMAREELVSRLTNEQEQEQGNAADWEEAEENSAERTPQAAAAAAGPPPAAGGSTLPGRGLAAAAAAAAAARAPQELAQLQARAMNAELQLELMQREYASLSQELAKARQEVARSQAAQQAASRAAADSAEDMHRLEFRYQRSIEQLEEQVRGLQRANWARDLGAGPAAGLLPGRGMPAGSYQQQHQQQGVLPWQQQQQQQHLPYTPPPYGAGVRHLGPELSPAEARDAARRISALADDVQRGFVDGGRPAAHLGRPSLQQPEAQREGQSGGHLAGCMPTQHASAPVPRALEDAGYPALMQQQQANASAAHHQHDRSAAVAFNSDQHPHSEVRHYEPSMHEISSAGDPGLHQCSAASREVGSSWGEAMPEVDQLRKLQSLLLAGKDVSDS